MSLSVSSDVDFVEVLHDGKWDLAEILTRDYVRSTYTVRLLTNMSTCMIPFSDVRQVRHLFMYDTYTCLIRVFSCMCMCVYTYNSVNCGFNF